MTSTTTVVQHLPATMSSKDKTKENPNDPRRPALERSFKILPNEFTEENDMMNLFALSCGMMGLWFRYRFFMWQALLFSVVSMVNTKADFDFKQLLSSFSIAIMGLVMAYFGPQAASFI